MKYLELLESLQKSSENQGHIVMMKNGIFFIGIGKDAIILNKLLNLKCVCMKENLCKVGFQTRSIEKYIRELKNLNKSFVIYNYDKTLEAIETFIGVKPSNHIRIKEYFNPDNSIENTQVFNIDESWKKEIGLIEKELSEFLYVFPYNRVPDRKLWFDTPGTTNVKIKSK